MQPGKVIETIVTPFQKFIRMEASSGLVLLIAAGIALVWANTPWAEYYFQLWDTKVTVSIGQTEISKRLLIWINDGLMAIFFFLVGLEIKREILEGELSTVRKATLPFMAALGGMVVPVGLFLLLNYGSPGMEGWGVPMATDIAFSLGILALLGSRVTLGMNVFLTAFAIVDDIGAVLVIAFFYSHGFHPDALITAGSLLAVLVLINYIGVKNIWMYLVIGLFVWYYFLKSGIHPTIAGVLLAFTIPAQNKIRLETFIRRMHRYRRMILERRDDKQRQGEARFLPKEDISIIQDIKREAKKVQPPLQRLESNLNEFVAFFIMPLFAFANGGISIINTDENLFTLLTLSIALGLFVGKTIGIFAFSWASAKAGVADLPEQTSWSHILGLSMLGGVGFTMALFIANLAFDPGGLLNQAKMGILIGTLGSGAIGLFLLRLMTKPRTENPDSRKESTRAVDEQGEAYSVE